MTNEDNQLARASSCAVKCWCESKQAAAVSLISGRNENSCRANGAYRYTTMAAATNYADAAVAATRRVVSSNKDGWAVLSVVIARPLTRAWRQRFLRQRFLRRRWRSQAL